MRGGAPGEAGEPGAEGQWDLIMGIPEGEGEAALGEQR